MRALHKILILGILSLSSLDLFSETDDSTFIVDAVGKILNKNDEIADNSRDNNIPMLYDKNQADLMRKRDRRLRAQGKCCPPPDVIVSPYIYVPSPKRYDYSQYPER